jgi:protoheme IX farnesyltransferase
VKTIAVSNESSASIQTRLADFVELTKPRIALMVLFTVAIGAWLASPGNLDLLRLVHTILGTALVACGASALNQLLERRSDALMRRTENRPLPAGRLQLLEVLCFGLSMSLGGLLYLALTLRDPIPVLVVWITLSSYVLVYTPLKRHTIWNTIIGAVPGALPPVIGWTAMGGPIGLEVVVLFGVLFLWQVPHFYAIAWIHREDYARAGLRMLPVMDRCGRLTGQHMIAFSGLLLVVSLVPALAGQAGPIYWIGAAMLGLGFLLSTFGFLRLTSKTAARRVLRASLAYLPLLLVLLVIDRGLGL